MPGTTGSRGPSASCRPASRRSAEMCGVFGAVLPESFDAGGAEAGAVAALGLFALQHRGQESAGLAVSDGEQLMVYKDLGMVSSVLDERRLPSLRGRLAIAHCRYSTTGSTVWENAQPTFRLGPRRAIAIGHNGNLVNTRELLGQLRGGRARLPASTDTELLTALLADEPAADTVDALVRVLPRVRGAYSLVVLDERRVIGVRDPHGFRPLVLGRLPIDRDRSPAATLTPSLWADDAALVMPVPDTGAPAAAGYAEASGVPYREGLVRNRYSGRTFIQPSQTMRQRGVTIKLNPLREVVRGRRLAVVDDSIVRGNTTAQIVSVLRRAGAAEVHVRISAPPIYHPCFYGIDTQIETELIAATNSVEQIRDFIGADSLGYLSIGGVLRALDLPYERFCFACFDGKYPAPVPYDATSRKFMLEADVAEAPPLVW